MSRTTICVVTGSRAEYGLLHDIMRGIRETEWFTLQVAVTGMHLAPEFGNTYEEIEEDGFTIDEKVEMLLSSDTATGIGKSVGLGVIGFADAFRRLQPDLVLLLGDRFEIFAAAAAAFTARIPIAHIAGGDTTEGAFDESLRHCITKLASLHFVTNAASRRRVLQLGEDPSRVILAGHPGIDRIRRLPLLDRETVEERLGFAFRPRNVLVTYHPVTWSADTSSMEFEQVLKALDRLGDTTGILFTKPNADPEGRTLSRLIDDFAAARPHVKAFASLGQLLYFSTVRQVDVVVGNSSSGVIETPALRKPSVDIGIRQQGRPRAASVLHCDPVAGRISAALDRAWKLDCSNVNNPYGDGTSSAAIVAELRRFSGYGRSGIKVFFEVGEENDHSENADYRGNRRQP